jgi:Na+/proline symporter/nitrogen-specific signal transduction histidine kinase
MGMLNVLVAVSLAYVLFLFVVAFLADHAAARGHAKWLQSPLIYTLSLSIYCTAWTFYGAVGYAARSGLEYLTIYLGPSIVMIGWWWGLRKLVRIGRSQRVTSIADLISSRFGKSNSLAVVVTVIAVVGTTPYIALQLQSVTLALEAFAGEARTSAGHNATALWLAAGLALFTVLFGTRNLDANERHDGVVMAIAVEAVVKLLALVAVGLFVVWGIAGGVGPVMEMISQSEIAVWQVSSGRWAGLMFLSAAALLTLPRMFQVLVVENEDERHLATASWAFPAYLMAMSFFVVPIAVVGLELMPAGANPDLFVLTLPLSQGQDALAMLSFLGGFSSATSMVIVAAIALSTMVSNHIVMPIWLSSQGASAMVAGDVRHVVLLSRRLSIMGVLALGYFYFHATGGGEALAAIGLISFAGVAQTLPALLGGIFWRGATRVGALAGLVIGFVIWGYTMFMPSFGPDVFFTQDVLDHGPLGLSWLRPQALFGISGLDPMIHALVWSMSLNALFFVVASLVSFPTPLERLQGAQFVNVFDHSARPGVWSRGAAEAEDLLVMAQRILGPADAQALFRSEAASQGITGYLPQISPEFLQRLEREMAGSVGAATAHAMIGQIMGRASVTVEDLMAVADETAQIMEYSNQLEAKSAELVHTTRQLRAANEKLTQISHQKDAFLSQISHELRTPMTSIRAFSEILRDGGTLELKAQEKYAGIIHDEAIRLTRLLDDLLDLSVLENGQVSLNMRAGTIASVLDQAMAAAGAENNPMRIRRSGAREDVRLYSDLDRLAQVFINLISNAQKYCDANSPVLTISVREVEGQLVVDFTDNGSGIPKASQEVIFEKFSRVGSDQSAGGAGLGLAICREIMLRLGGQIAYLPGQGGASFRVTLPDALEMAAQ